MSSTTPFGEILDAADRLPLEDQQELVTILQRRISQAGREQCVADAEEALRELALGKCRPASPDDLMREIME